METNQTIRTNEYIFEITLAPGDIRTVRIDAENVGQAWRELGRVHPEVFDLVTGGTVDYSVWKIGPTPQLLLERKGVTRLEGTR
jgi:hypothetical protein